MSLLSEQHSFTHDVVSLLTYLHVHGYEVSLGEVQRPLEMQEIYVRTKRSQTMNSQHIKKLAIDLFIFLNGKLLTTHDELAAIGKFWEGLNPANVWGGNWKTFKDMPHFERRA